VAQSIKRRTLDFGSGRDLGVVGSGPASDSMLSMMGWRGPARCSLPLPLPALGTCSLSL